MTAQSPESEHRDRWPIGRATLLWLVLGVAMGAIIAVVARLVSGFWML